jgi:hypothetical protein
VTGKAQRMTHDEKRNGTASLYAALEIATREVTRVLLAQHTHEQFVAFLSHAVRVYPPQPLSVVLDNFSTDSTPEFNCWVEPPRGCFVISRRPAVLDEHGQDRVVELTKPQLGRTRDQFKRLLGVEGVHRRGHHDPRGPSPVPHALCLALAGRSRRAAPEWGGVTPPRLTQIHTRPRGRPVRPARVAERES